MIENSKNEQINNENKTINSSESIDLSNQKKQGHLFPLRKIQKLSPNPDLFGNEKTYYEYSISRNLVFYKNDQFSVVKGKHKKTKSLKIVKVYDKEGLNNEDLVASVKREILLHQNLKNSKCILKLERTFETQTSIYFIYEGGQLVGKDVDKAFEGNHKIAKNALCQVMIGLGEVNSYGFSLISFNWNNVVLTADGDFKIFNFWNLRPHKGIEEDEESANLGLDVELDEEYKRTVDPNYLKYNNIGPATDTWPLAVLIADTYNQFGLLGQNFELPEKEFHRDFYLKNLRKNENLDQSEKDMFDLMFKTSPGKRLPATDALLQENLYTLLSKNPELVNKLSASNTRKKVDLEKLKKNFMEDLEASYLLDRQSSPCSLQSKKDVGSLEGSEKKEKDVPKMVNLKEKNQSHSFDLAGGEPKAENTENEGRKTVDIYRAKTEDLKLGDGAEENIFLKSGNKDKMAESEVISQGETISFRAKTGEEEEDKSLKGEGGKSQDGKILSQILDGENMDLEQIAAKNQNAEKSAAKSFKAKEEGDGKILSQVLDGKDVETQKPKDGNDGGLNQSKREENNLEKSDLGKKRDLSQNESKTSKGVTVTARHRSKPDKDKKKKVKPFSNIVINKKTTKEEEKVDDPKTEEKSENGQKDEIQEQSTEVQNKGNPSEIVLEEKKEIVKDIKINPFKNDEKTEVKDQGEEKPKIVEAESEVPENKKEPEIEKEVENTNKEDEGENVKEETKELAVEAEAEADPSQEQKQEKDDENDASQEAEDTNDPKNEKVDKAENQAPKVQTIEENKSEAIPVPENKKIIENHTEKEPQTEQTNPNPEPPKEPKSTPPPEPAEPETLCEKKTPNPYLTESSLKPSTTQKNEPKSPDHEEENNLFENIGKAVQDKSNHLLTNTKDILGSPFLSQGTEGSGNKGQQDKSPASRDLPTPNKGEDSIEEEVKIVQPGLGAIREDEKEDRKSILDSTLQDLNPFRPSKRSENDKSPKSGKKSKSFLDRNLSDLNPFGQSSDEKEDDDEESKSGGILEKTGNFLGDGAKGGKDMLGRLVSFGAEKDENGEKEKSGGGGGLFEGVKGAGQGLMKGTKDIGKKALDSTKSAAKNLKNGAKDAGKGLVNGTKKAGGGLIDGTKNVGSGILDGTKNAGNGLMGWTKNAGKGLVNGTKDIGKKAIDGTKDVGEGLIKGTTNTIQNTTNKLNPFKKDQNSKNGSQKKSPENGLTSSKSKSFLDRSINDLNPFGHDDSEQADNSQSPSKPFLDRSLKELNPFAGEKEEEKNQNHKGKRKYEIQRTESKIEKTRSKIQKTRRMRPSVQNNRQKSRKDRKNKGRGKQRGFLSKLAGGFLCCAEQRDHDDGDEKVERREILRGRKLK